MLREALVAMVSQLSEKTNFISLSTGVSETNDTLVLTVPLELTEYLEPGATAWSSWA